MTDEDIIESVSDHAISDIEEVTLREGMDITTAAEVCRGVARRLQERATLFDHEALSMHEGDA